MNSPRTGSHPALQAAPATAMRITITAGTGTGSTKLSAFDAALRHAGVANYNLVRLSSVIPPNATVRSSDEVGTPDERGEWGDRLYVVLAECRVDVLHEEAWAGIGWVQDRETGRGLFVEHEGHSRSQVEADVVSSLQDLMNGRPEVDFGDIDLRIEGGTCDNQPLCALVVATYESDPWRGEDVLTLP